MQSGISLVTVYTVVYGLKEIDTTAIIIYSLPPDTTDIC